MIEKVNQYMIRTGLPQTTPNEVANAIGINAKSLRQKFRDLQKEGKPPANISQPDGVHWIIRNPDKRML
jgi:predicted transcriptional regulator